MAEDMMPEDVTSHHLLPRDGPSREHPSGSIGTAILFENQQVRVWSVDVEAGGKKAWHQHHLPYVIVPIGDGKIELESQDGRIVQIEDTSGAAIWRDAGEIHELRNRGAGTYRNVLIEIKSAEDRKP